MDDMYYSVTLGLGEYGNLVGILFEEVSVNDDFDEVSRKTIKEIKRVRQDVSHVNIVEDDKIIMKTYYTDNVLKRIEGNETHTISANKFQIARYNKTRDIITCQTNSSEITIDANKGIIKEIKKIGKKGRNNKTLRVNTEGLFPNKNKINPLIVKLAGELATITTDQDTRLYTELTDESDCCYLRFGTVSKDTFKKARDLILRYSEEFLIFLNFGK